MSRRRSIALEAVAAALLASLMLAGFSYVHAKAAYWGIQDASAPGVDTGSIRATQSDEGQSGAYTTGLNGYAGLRVSVTKNADPHNGLVMRGFGLRFDGADTFSSTAAVMLGGVTITRSIVIRRESNYGRWLDTFTNTTQAPISLAAAFGGQTSIPTGRPGTAAMPDEQTTITGSVDFRGNWLDDPFHTPLAASGYESNFPAFVNRLVVPPGQSRSLLHFVVVAEPAEMAETARKLQAAPDVAGLSVAEQCSIVNFQLPCAGRSTVLVPQPPPPPPVPATTSSRYDVVEKSIAELRRDMESGKTTSVAIVQAYLDRIAAYDRGQFGLHSFEIVAADALAQARAADAARKARSHAALLGIPIAVKNLYDTRDMATTNGSLTFAGFRPTHDATQVARLRAAGAVILGKAAMEEYATSGFYSNDAWGQVWNAYDPSRSALGSSGGSAVAVAASFAAAALGTQTGDSLYGPASAASLVTLRGTDGLESGAGIMPLVWMTDFGGVLARSVPDLAAMLNAVAGTDPADPATANADAQIPKDWRSVLVPNALKGKRIGYIPSAWVDPFGTSDEPGGVIATEKAALKYFTDAGATVVDMGTAALPRTRDTSPGDVVSEGWMQYIDQHPELAMQGFAIHSAVDVACSQKKIAYVREPASACQKPPAPRMTPAEIDAKRAFRRQRQAAVKAWMDAAGVDAIVYPGLLSEISVNDSGGDRASFGRRDTPSAANGVPTIAFPAGADAAGNPVDIQLMGRAWSDAELVGMAYAYEYVAQSHGHGHVAPTKVPRLRFKPIR
ncbi:MAG TPA: amidase [Terriglobales bacterium]|nr:amidase [Terriglobales bacterium]